MSDGGDCRTAPATPGLLNINDKQWDCLNGIIPCLKQRCCILYIIILDLIAFPLVFLSFMISLEFPCMMKF